MNTKNIPPLRQDVSGLTFRQILELTVDEVRAALVDLSRHD